MKSKRIKWRQFGDGENNVVYKGVQGKHKYALKIPKEHSIFSDPERVSRKWNATNPDLPATALTGPQIRWETGDRPRSSRACPQFKAIN